jgi:hypothetical protein
MKKHYIVLIPVFIAYSSMYSQSIDTRRKMYDSQQRRLSRNKNMNHKNSDHMKMEESYKKYRFGFVPYETDPSRFVTIAIDAQDAINEISFWARQMSEHALFNHLGLEDAELKKEALDIHKSLESFIAKFNKDPHDTKHMSEILPLLKKEREFQVKVLKTLSESKWIGWLFPLFENHLTFELDYFVDKLNGVPYSVEKELYFWNRINSEHAAFSSHLLDPSERKLSFQAQVLSDKFFNLPPADTDMMVYLSLKAGKELDVFYQKAKAHSSSIKSIIHPSLLDHDKREGERSIQVLSALASRYRANQEPNYNKRGKYQRR